MTKRVLDIAISTFGLIVALPLIVLAALLVKIESAGPVFFRSKRVGMNSELFTLVKIRSMSGGTDFSGSRVTAGGDYRITRVGRVLRRSKLDELPQLWNVLKGDMSLVGPRPEDPSYLPWYTQQQLELLEHRPGITSPASVTFRDEEAILRNLVADGLSLDDAYRQVQNEKLSIDLTYFRHRTLITDMRCMLNTISAVIHGSEPRK
jgi:lipopolysaccharide/colanic/teichoic acid biosynthesis glycosyltransferase